MSKLQRPLRGLGRSTVSSNVETLEAPGSDAPAAESGLFIAFLISDNVHRRTPIHDRQPENFSRINRCHLNSWLYIFLQTIRGECTICREPPCRVRTAKPLSATGNSTRNQFPRDAHRPRRFKAMARTASADGRSCPLL